MNQTAHSPCSSSQRLFLFRSQSQWVLAFFEEHAVKLRRVLTGRGTSRSKTSITPTRRPRARRPTGWCERFHKPALNAFCRVALRKQVYHRSVEELQANLDAWLCQYDESRSHQGRWRFGKTPMQTFLDALPMSKEKNNRSLINIRLAKSDRSTATRLSDRVSANTTNAGSEGGRLK